MVKRNKTRRSIPQVVIPDAKTLKFSFKYLDFENSKFAMSQCPLEFWPRFVAELKRYSLGSVDEFTDANNDDHRHFIHFQETSEVDGFPNLNMAQVAYDQPWQFCIGKEQWRVMGFVIDDTFYIVWLDTNHALYSGGGKPSKR